MTKRLSFTLVLLLGVLGHSNVFAEEELWHQVIKDANIYDIWVDSSEELNGRFIFQGDILLNKINYIRVTQDGVTIQSFPLIKELISIAENAVYMAGTPFSGFIYGNHLDKRTRNPDGYDYTYYALPTHCDLPFLVLAPVGLDNYYKRKACYLQAMIEIVAQPRRYEQLNQQEYLTYKLEDIIRNGAAVEEEISIATETIISNLTETGLWYRNGVPIQMSDIRGSHGQKLFTY